MYSHLGCHSARYGQGAQVADDEGIDTRLGKRGQVALELGQLLLVHHDVAGDVDVDAALMGVGHHSRHLAQAEVAGPRPHAELVACQIDRIRPKADGVLELLPTARRGQELGFAAP